MAGREAGAAAGAAEGRAVWECRSRSMTGCAPDALMGCAAAGGQFAPAMAPTGDVCGARGVCACGAGTGLCICICGAAPVMGCCCMNGLACAGAVAAGEVIVAPHCGHGPDTPAICAGTVSGMPQVWQLKWMTLGAGFMSTEEGLPF